MGVVIGRSEHLPAGQILVGGRDATADRHGGGVERLGGAETRQRRAIGAHQEGGLDDVALRLLQRERGEVLVVERALVHHAGAGQSLLLADLGDGDFRHGRIAAARLGDEVMRGEDSGLAAFHCDIHQRAS